ncbi:MAG: nitroreductase family protein [Spirochaetaceae bacterium]|nr:nitroreductase family protein [Spirochaetaceae bacterium]MCF7949540.1 nitroreductase family protein [Spirochaetia bacterium]MCF7952020.1 nitroreductase family protein [Spirochaetaceae bacterium]
MMDAMECILSRTSIRSFSDQAVEEDILRKLLDAGMAAPSAVNMQPWMFVVIHKRELLDTLADKLPYAKMLKQAPVAIVVCGDLRKTLDQREREYWVEDCSAAAENILLAAHALGLGAVWTAVHPVPSRINAVQSTLHMPEYLIPLNVMPLGYPAESKEPKQKWDEGKIHWNSWNEE